MTGKRPFLYVQRRAFEKKMPLSCQLDLTYQCNLNGRHCYIVREDRPELSTSEIKDILDQLAEAGTLFLSFSGGEILLRKDFFSLADYARKLNFALRLLTNGTLIDKAAAGAIAALSPVQVTVSLYSTDAGIHDDITGMPNAFLRTAAAVRELRERDVPVKLSCLIMKNNFSEYDGVKRLAEKLGCVFQADPHVTPRIDGNTAPLIFHINDHMLERVLADPGLKLSLQIKSSEIHSEPEFEDIPCLAAYTSCYISPYGDVYPCVQFPLRCGNLREESFIDIWRHSPVLEKVRAAAFSRLPDCSECELLLYCRRCPGLAWLMRKDYTASYDMACREAGLVKKIET